MRWQTGVRCGVSSLALPVALADDPWPERRPPQLATLIARIARVNELDVHISAIRGAVYLNGDEVGAQCVECRAGVGFASFTFTSRLAQTTPITLRRIGRSLKTVSRKNAGEVRVGLFEWDVSLSILTPDSEAGPGKLRYDIRTFELEDPEFLRSVPDMFWKRTSELMNRMWLDYKMRV